MTDATESFNLSELAIAEISSKDCVSKFSCGEPDIDKWARKKAFKFHSQHRARVFCAKAKGASAALGFYSLSFSALTSNALRPTDNLYTDDQAPFIYIDWLAVIKSCQSNGIGTICLIDALRRAYVVSRHVPVYGVALRSLNERTKTLYEKHGFSVRDDNVDHPLMILPIWFVIDLFKESTPLSA